MGGSRFPLWKMDHKKVLSLKRVMCIGLIYHRKTELKGGREYYRERNISEIFRRNTQLQKIPLLPHQIICRNGLP